MDFKQTICENEEFDRLVSKLAFEIKNTLDVKNLAFVGVKTRGVPLAERLAKEIKKQPKQTKNRWIRLDRFLSSTEQLYLLSLTTLN